MGVKLPVTMVVVPIMIAMIIMLFLRMLFVVMLIVPVIIMLFLRMLFVLVVVMIYIRNLCNRFYIFA